VFANNNEKTKTNGTVNAFNRMNEKPSTQKPGHFNLNPNEPASKALISKTRNQKPKTADIKKMTFLLATDLHSKLKSYSNRKGHPMQFLLEMMVEDLIKNHPNKELVSNYQEEDMERVKTTFDMTPELHNSLKEFKKKRHYKMRFIFEALTEEYLKSVGEL
jgi:hypothetical protein